MTLFATGPLPPRSLRGRLAGCAVAALFALSSGCSGVPGLTGTGDDLGPATQRLLDRQAASLLAGDVDGYLGPVDGPARQFHQSVARALVALPLDGLELVLGPRRIPEDRLPAEVLLQLRYTFQGMPADTFVTELAYTLDGTADDMAITESRFAGPRPVWDSGPLDHTRSANFLALHRPSMQEAESKLAIAEEALGELSEQLAEAAAGPYLLILARDHLEYRELSGSSLPFDIARSAEASFSLAVLPSGIEVQGRHMVADVGKLDRDRSTLETLKHELTHLVLAADTMPFTPAWVAESAAMLMAGERPAWVWRRAVADGHLASLSFARMSGDLQLGRHGWGDDTPLHYAYAAAAAFYLSETYGHDAFLEFYRFYASVPPEQVYRRLPRGQVAFAEEPSMIELAQETTTEALRGVFGIDEAELDRGVRQWIHTQVEQTG